MPRILVDPLNLNYVLVGLAALTSAAYFIRVRGKTASTWYMLGALVALAVYYLVQAFWAFTHGAVQMEAAFLLTPEGMATVVAGGLGGPFLAQAAYRFAGNPFRREANGVLVASILTVLASTMWVYVNTSSATAVSRWLVAFWALWGVTVLVRKRRRTPISESTARDRSGMLAVAGFLFVVVVSEVLVGINLYRGSPGSFAVFVVGQILQFTVVLAFPVVYVQFAKEPTTFQVKLVGFVLLTVLSVFGVLTANESAMDDKRMAFDPAPAPHSLVFTPVGASFEVRSTPLFYERELGEDLRLGDDTKAVVPVPFGFPFAGDTLHTVVVSGNGSIEPADAAYPFGSFSEEFPTLADRPLIAPWYTDLNPGAGGSVHARAHPDRLVVTWTDVPEWNYFRPFTVQAVLHASGQIDFNYAVLPFDTQVGANGILVDTGLSLAGGTAGLTSLDPLTGIGPVANPIAIYDRRLEFKAYLHRETMPFVWVVLGTVAFVLFVAPLFFRSALTKPLDRLLMGMRKVNDGDLEAELPVLVKDEFGNLAQNFNRMTRSLRTYSHEMESLVAERTRELNASLDSLKATQEQLVQQEKLASLGQLTAGIAHEIKNPLNFINNFAEVNAELADELKDAVAKGEDPTALLADLKRNAEVIAEHGRRADSIVRSMMEHARRGAAEKEPVEVNAFVEEYVNLAWHGHRAAHSGFHVTLDRSYAEDAGSAMMVRQDMARVLINLLGNAFDAVSGDGGSAAPTVSVVTRRRPAADGSGPAVVIEIRDNGPGVPPELRQKIFEPFFTTKPTGRGTGLGLSLSYDIVTSGHGGSMELAEAEGGGAVFMLALPVP